HQGRRRRRVRRGARPQRGVGAPDLSARRKLGEGASVEIGGVRHPLVGRVSMDQIVVDTGDVLFPRGTTATVFGPEGGAVPSAQEWARW
ncbi:alanine racemase C-terminal domain-containing protein, partial [Bacillus sp. SIMBA_005]|uniref:alanine racemase C-terminal domain-containing protein n=1 Tax=Bacillus sp. SIMBA_005 TaxID=3085754 RepID=UPI00397ACE9B